MTLLGIDYARPGSDKLVVMTRDGERVLCVCIVEGALTEDAAEMLASYFAKCRRDMICQRKV